MFEDEESKPQRIDFQHRLLEPLSVSDLRDYISTLQAEIARVEAEIARKQSARGAADSVFNF